MEEAQVTQSSLFLTDVSLCDMAAVEPGALDRTGAACAQLGIDRMEAPIDCLNLLRAGPTPGVPVVVRCSGLAADIETTYQPGVVGITVWINSALSMSRRPGGVSRPPSTQQLRRSVEAARARGLDVTVAFPMETDRSRALLSLGYFAQSCGANRVRLVESTGALHPLDLYRILRSLRERLNAPLEVDLSDACGLAVGCALCAMRAGVRHLVVTTSPGQQASQHIPVHRLHLCERLGPPRVWAET